MPKKSDMKAGLEYLLNHPTTSPFKNPQGMSAFKAVIDSSEMPLTQVIKYIGKKGKTKPPKKSDKEKSEERLEKLEEETNAK